MWKFTILFDLFVTEEVYCQLTDKDRGQNIANNVSKVDSFDIIKFPVLKKKMFLFTTVSANHKLLILIKQTGK